MFPARCFQPAPRVDSARVDIRRAPGLTPLADRALWTVLDAAYRTPGKPVRAAIGFALAKRNPHKLLGACEIDPAAPAGHVPPERWAVLARTLAEDRSLHWTPLPKALSGKGNSRDGNGGHGLPERGTRTPGTGDSRT
jgi:23S rRNA (adenine-N6)-dimethyltransferase